MTRLKLAILISGRGSNMRAILDAAEDPSFPAEPVLILSNRPDADGLAHASARGIATAAIDHKPFGKDREAFERKMQDVLEMHDVEMVVLAGFMRILTPYFVSKWSGRMINIHPSLLPPQCIVLKGCYIRCCSEFGAECRLRLRARNWFQGRHRLSGFHGDRCGGNAEAKSRQQ